jgi:hypothetical protein
MVFFLPLPMPNTHLARLEYYCGGELGATQHVVWSRAPGQIFLRSGTRGGGSCFPTTFVRRQSGRQDTRNQFYSLRRVRKRAIYYYRYFLSSAILLGIRQCMSAYSPAIPQEQLLGRLSAFCCFSTCPAVAVYYRYSYTPFIPSTLPSSPYSARCVRLASSNPPGCRKRTILSHDVFGRSFWIDSSGP